MIIMTFFSLNRINVEIFDLKFQLTIYGYNEQKLHEVLYNRGLLY